MIKEIQQKVKKLLEDGTVKGFLSIREFDGQIGPYLFTDSNDLNGMSLGDYLGTGDARYPLNLYLQKIIKKYPDEPIGILVRGCDERGLVSLKSWNQIREHNVIVPVGFACTQEQAEICECAQPYPDNCEFGTKVEPRAWKSVADVEAMDMADRFAFWQKEYNKCIKCYGCRNVCPVCFCNECSLEDDNLIRKGESPPEIPIFHLVRAVHMAGRCIDCGLCNDVCPMEIPLRTLYKKVAQILKEDFNYTAGVDLGKSPLQTLGEA